MAVARPGIYFKNMWLLAQMISHVYLLPAVKYTIGDSLIIIAQLLYFQVAKSWQAYIVWKWGHTEKCCDIFLFIYPYMRLSVSAIIHKVAETASTTNSLFYLF